MTIIGRMSEIKVTHFSVQSQTMMIAQKEDEWQWQFAIFARSLLIGAVHEPAFSLYYFTLLIPLGFIA